MGIQTESELLQCTICNNFINDMYFLIVGNKMPIHMNCLKCSVCLNKLGELESKCYFNNGKFYCSHHWQQAFKDFCFACKLKINSNDYVIRALNDQLFHLNCFTCLTCKKHIEPGSKYGIFNEQVYCSQHYFSTGSSSTTDLNNNTNTNSNNSNNHAHRFDQSISPLSSSGDSSSPLSVLSSAANTKPLQTNLNNNKSMCSSNNSKKKRIRTSFKHTQLRIMKAHFQINQNPDSKDLKELSERTGLQKRVLQVWFQNSRAKQRKSTGTGVIGLANPIGSGITSSNSTNQLLNSIESSQDYKEDYEDLDEDEENLEEEEEYDEANYSLDDNSNSNSTSMCKPAESINHQIDFYHHCY